MSKEETKAQIEELERRLTVVEQRLVEILRHADVVGVHGPCAHPSVPREAIGGRRIAPPERLFHPE